MLKEIEGETRDKCLDAKGTTPVYNLLPDILSNLSGEASLPQKGFQDIMRHLLQYIGKEKHADSLVDKLCGRFQSTRQLRQWRNLAFCIAQVTRSRWRGSLPSGSGVCSERGGG